MNVKMDSRYVFGGRAQKNPYLCKRIYGYILRTESMAIGSFFKQRQIKQFNYQPRFYNEDKELREKRMRAIECEVAMGKGEKVDKYESNIRGAFRQKREDVSRIQRKSNTRILLIFGILLVVVYFAVFK